MSERCDLDGADQAANEATVMAMNIA